MFLILQMQLFYLLHDYISVHDCVDERPSYY